MSVLTDPSTYPISAAAARQLDRPLFGHVVDGEAVPSLDGGTMPVIDPATGEQVATAAAGSAADVERAVQVRARGVRRRPLALPGAARAGAAAAQARRADRRARRRARRARRHRLGPAAALRGVHRPVRGRRASTTTRAGRRSCTAASPPCRASSPSTRCASRSAWSGRSCRGTGPTAAAAMGAFALCAGNSVVLKPAEQTPMTARRGRRAGARGGDPAGRVQRRPGRRRDRRRRRSSPIPRSTRSRSPARTRPGARSRPAPRRASSA